MLDIDIICEQKDYKKDLNCGTIFGDKSCYYFCNFEHNECNYYIKPDNVNIFSLEIYNTSNEKKGFKIISDKDGVIGSWKIKSKCIVSIHQSFITNRKLILIMDKPSNDDKFVFKIISPTDAQIMCPNDEHIKWLCICSQPRKFVPL